MIPTDKSANMILDWFSSDPSGLQIAPRALLKHCGNPAPLDWLIGKTRFEINFKEIHFLGTTEKTAQSVVQLDDVFDLAPEIEIGITPRPFEIEKVKQLSILFGNHHDIGVLQIIVVNTLPMKRLESQSQAA